MEAIFNTAPGQATTGVQPSEKTTDSQPEVKSAETQPEQSSGEDFSAFLMKSLGRTGQDQVNEEELFSSIISQRLSLQSEEASDFYEEKVKALSTTMARSDGYVPIEDVAKAALRETVAASLVSNEVAETINAEAFRAAQLDNNLLALWDGRGTTSAMATMEEAMFKVKEIMDQLEAGELTLSPRPLDVPSNTGMTPGMPQTPAAAAQGEAARVEHGEHGEHAEHVEESEEAEDAEKIAEGTGEKQVRFTWKHIARDGNLAILLPTRLNGQIEGVSLYDDKGNLIEEGDYSKQTGDRRAVYRFNEPGSAYGDNIDAVVYLEDGQTLTYLVRDGGKRTYVPQDDYTKRSVEEFEADMKAKRDAANPPAETPNPVTAPEATSTAANNTGSSGSNDSGASDSGSGAADAGSNASSDSGSADSASNDSGSGDSGGSSDSGSSDSGGGSDESSKDSASA